MSAADLLDRIGAWPATWRYGLLCLLALAFFLPGFASLPPIDRDESRFAQATKQMVETGDYVDIRFQADPRHKKPAGIYWMQAVSVHLTGARDAIWAYRIPSLIGAVAAVLLTALIGGMLFSTGVGFGAGVVMAASVLLNVEARTAKTDAMLLALTLAALACLIRVAQGRGKGRSAYGFWAALGAAFMVKGPIPFLPVAGLIVAKSWQDRGVGWLRRLHPLTGVLLFLVLAAPWYVAITVISDGGFFDESVGKDLIAKVGSGQESHGAPPGLYLALASVTFWPFSLLGLLALPWIWRNRKQPEVFLLLGWALLAWIIFEATPTKLAHYVLPVYPALAILAVAALRQTNARGARPAGKELHDMVADIYLPARPGARTWRALVKALWFIILFALMLAMPILGQQLKLPFDPVWLGGVLLLGAGYGGWHVFGGRGAEARHLLAILVSALLFSGLVFGRFLPNLDPGFISPRLVAALPDRPGCAQPWLASAGFTEPSLVFLTATRTRLVRGAAAADHLAAEPQCGVAAIEARETQAFLDRAAETGQRLRTVGTVGTVEGFNYARGKQLTITLYIPDGAP